MTTQNIPNCLQAIVTSLMSMRAVPLQERDEEFEKLLSKMEKYCKKNCKHQIVYDEIDVDPERSASIKYCENCYLTF